MQIQNAYDILSDPSTRTSYDEQFPAIRNAWIRHDTEMFRWVQHDKRRQEEEQAEAQAREKRRVQKAEYNKKWKAKKTRQRAEEAERVANEETRTRAEEQRAKNEQYKRDCEANVEREAAQRQAAEQIRAEQIAAEERMRRSREDQAEARSRLVAAQAQEEHKKAAEMRLLQIHKEEAMVRMRKIARLSREEAEKEERKREEDEAEAIKQWQAVIEQAQEREAFERARIEQENATRQNTIAAEWRKANLRRQGAQDKDTKPNINDLRRNYDQSSEDINRRETAAAEKFIQEIMEIRGESKSEVLKDAVLITLEAVDREIAAQKEGRKRKSLHDDPARLPALVTELFAKMEANEETPEKFRFSKKRKVT